MKILINGNLGYIGPVLVSRLRQTWPDARLIGFDSGFFAGCLLNPLTCPERLLDEQHYGDVRRFPAKILEGVDAVIQLAAVSNDPMGKAFERPTEEINAVSAVEIARAASAVGVRRFIFASSCSVYGAGGNEARDEEAPLNPLTAYARSKIEAEEALKPLASDSFLVTCFRFATACGMSPRLRLDLVLNDFVAGALAEGAIRILSDGTPWRPLIHVEDMARAMEWGCLRSLEKGGPHLVLNAGANSWNYRIADLARAVQAVLGRESVEISINTQAAPDRRSYRVCFDRFAGLAPGHTPRITLDQAVHGLAEGLRECGFQDRSFRHSHFIRLKVLEDLRRAPAGLNADLYWK